MVFSVSNDSNNVYLLLSFRDPGWAMAVRRTGLTIWLDPAGKKGRQFELFYRGGPSLGELQELKGPDGLPEPNMMPPEARASEHPSDTGAFNKLQVITPDDSEPANLATDGSQGPAADHGVPHGIFCYELAVPLDSAGLEPNALAARLGRIIGIGARWGDRDRIDRSAPSHGMAGGRPGMGGQRPGGGRKGPAAAGRGERRQDVSEQEIWVRTRLATGEDTAAEHQ
jgi:hypothetical protein